MLSGQETIRQSETARPGHASSVALGRPQLALRLARAIDRLAAQRIRRGITLATMEVSFALLSVTAAAVIVYAGALWREPRLGQAAAILTLAKLLAGKITGAHAARWRFVGVRDAMTVARSAAIAGALGFLLLQWLQLVDTSMRLVIADTSIYIVLSCGARLASRLLHEWGRRALAGPPATHRRALIIGAGEAGSAVIKNMLSSPTLLMDPVAAVDDDRNKRGTRLHDVPIAGSVADLSAVVEKYQPDQIVIAIPSATGQQMGRVLDACTATRIPFRIAPDPETLLNGYHPGGLRVVQPSDLLGRPQVELDVDALRAELGLARIAITGAAGSIGAELTRQLVKLGPATLFLIDRNENDLHFLCDELQRRHVRVPHTEVIQDVRDQPRMARVMTELRPTHVFHAAAFKHVPLMETHLVEAVENNILGTWATLEAARAACVAKFVLISTDKAVRPISVMGATKRFVELLVSEATREGTPHSVIVRFGNVIGSNGSVVPLFQRQINEGGPVVVTSRQATRYFMTIAEASQLVLQAVAMPESVGKIAILDMGTPIRIWDLAERMIRLSGLRPGIDIEIVETDLRPGEKLHEELWWTPGNAMPSRHPRIALEAVCAKASSVTGLIPLFRKLVETNDDVMLRSLLAETVGLASQGEGDGQVRTDRRHSHPVEQPRAAS